MTCGRQTKEQSVKASEVSGRRSRTLVGVGTCRCRTNQWTNNQSCSNLVHYIYKHNLCDLQPDPSKKFFPSSLISGSDFHPHCLHPIYSERKRLAQETASPITNGSSFLCFRRHCSWPLETWPSTRIFKGLPQEGSFDGNTPHYAVFQAWVKCKEAGSIAQNQVSLHWQMKFGKHTKEILFHVEKYWEWGMFLPNILR